MCFFAEIFELVPLSQALVILGMDHYMRALAEEYPPANRHERACRSDLRILRGRECEPLRQQPAVRETRRRAEPLARRMSSSLSLSSSFSLPLSQESRGEYGVPRERIAWPVWQRHSTPGGPGVVQQWRQPCAM